MGFYAPAQIVRDARDHGVEVRPVCVNASRWDCILEPTNHPDRFAMRLGLRQVRGLANIDAASILAARADQAVPSIDDLRRRAGVPAASLVQIAEVDGFRPSMGLARREAFWAIKALRDEPLPLFAAASAREQAIVPEVDEPEVVQKPMKAGREVVEDYGHTGLTLREHPVTFVRQDLAREKFMTCAAASAGRDFQNCKVAGLVLVRQKPGSAKNVTFITLEDETGVANLVVWEQVHEKHRRTVLACSMLGVVGRIQREGDVVHVVAYKLIDLSAELASVGGRDAPFPLHHGRGDEFHWGPSAPDPRGREHISYGDIQGARTHPIRQKTRDLHYECRRAAPRGGRFNERVHPAIRAWPYMDNYLEIIPVTVHIGTMLKTSSELVEALASRIRVRRMAMGLPQQEAAQRSGIAYRTWRRLETEGRASIEDLIKAAIALRCEEALEALFPAPPATSLDELLKRQAKPPAGATTGPSRARGRRAKS